MFFQCFEPILLHHMLSQCLILYVDSHLLIFYRGRYWHFGGRYLHFWGRNPHFRGGTRRYQHILGVGTRRYQEEPGGTGRNWEEPGGTHLVSPLLEDTLVLKPWWIWAKEFPRKKKFFCFQIGSKKYGKWKLERSFPLLVFGRKKHGKIYYQRKTIKVQNVGQQ